jgi:hypothetical protein
MAGMRPGFALSRRCHIRMTYINKAAVNPR